MLPAKLGGTRWRSCLSEQVIVVALRPTIELHLGRCPLTPGRPIREILAPGIAGMAVQV
jgi:hypothetical protein